MGNLSLHPDSNGDPGDNVGLAPGRGSTTSTPRWLNVFGIIALVLILLFAVVLLAGGGHSPGPHTRSADAGGHLFAARGLDW
jgi:hypothetical protein